MLTQKSGFFQVLACLRWLLAQVTNEHQIDHKDVIIVAENADLGDFCSKTGLVWAGARFCHRP